MNEWATEEVRTAGPATRAEADVRAVLSALEGLSEPPTVCIEPPIGGRAERYARVRLHARGGLGQVWFGRDDLVGREVAIKEPRGDRPPAAARAALEREAWVLGQLQHPNVVPLFDLLRGPDGRAAYYVMPFLGGETLRDLAGRFHAARPAGPATRLTLLPILTAFLDVCAALDHAHGRGIWHLDIKGENVKLGPTGAAVVLDWGLARLSTPADGEPPAGCGAAGGTPAFMAPEQAGAGGTLGPRTDVYGLGALLYLLLTGRSPHPEATSCDRTELAAALRQPVSGPRKLWPGVPVALEAVCLKALAPDPADRYGSVGELRDEVRRWLADEELVAYREPLPARLARWCRRHKRVVSAAAAMIATSVLALAIGLVVVDHQRQDTERHRQAAEAALMLERDSFRQALKAGDDYFTAVSESRLLQEPGQQPLRRELLEHGLAYYRDFLARRGNDRALRAEVAAAWYRVGRIQFDIGALSDVVAAYRQALALGEELHAADPENAEVRAGLARWYIASATALRRSARFTDALGAEERAVALAGALPEADSRRVYLTALALAVRTAVLDQSGDVAGASAAAETAEDWFARADQDATTRVGRATNLIRVGLIRLDQNRLTEAADALRHAHQMFEDLLNEPGHALTARWRLADCDNSLGIVASAAGDSDTALACFEAALAGRRELVRQNPTVHTHRAELATTCMNLARQCRDRGDPRRAAEQAREACAQAEELMTRDPADFHYRSLATRTYRLAAGDAEASGDADEAARLRARSRDLLAGFASPGPRTVWQSLTRDAATDAGRQLHWGHWRAAVTSFLQAVECQRRTGPSDQRASASRQ